jgi:hypothetical protein
MRQAEKQLAAQAQASYERTVRDCKAASPKKKEAGASVTAGRVARQAREPRRLHFDTSSARAQSTT